MKLVDNSSAVGVDPGRGILPPLLLSNLGMTVRSCAREAIHEYLCATNGTRPTPRPPSAVVRRRPITDNEQRAHREPGLGLRFLTVRDMPQYFAITFG